MRREVPRKDLAANRVGASSGQVMVVMLYGCKSSSLRVILRNFGFARCSVVVAVETSLGHKMWIAEVT